MSRSRPHVVYWLKQPTPYFVERCNTIADRGNLEFEAWFNTRRESDRSWIVDEDDWRFPGRYVARQRTLGLSHHLPFAELADARPDVFIQEYDRGWLVAGFLGARVLADRTAFRVLPNYDAVSDRTWWREAGKHFVFRAVDGAKVSGPEAQGLTSRYGLPAERTWKVTQTIDVPHFAAARDVSAEQRSRRRDELGLTGCVFTYVGRLLDVKGVQVLLDAFEELDLGDRATLLIAGDGADEARYRRQTAGNSRVRWCGYVQRSELPELYALCDVLVQPTLGDAFGLVVEEALAAGLRVIATESSGDIRSRLPDGGPGVIVAPGDSAALAGAMRTAAQERLPEDVLARETLELVADLSPERYAQEFEAFVHGLLQAPRRRSISALAASLAGRGLLRLSSSAAPDHHRSDSSQASSAAEPPARAAR
jgi:glycosyltransferase involved in cell wall biosynthesis